MTTAQSWLTYLASNRPGYRVGVNTAADHIAFTRLTRAGRVQRHVQWNALMKCINVSYSLRRGK